MKRLGPDLKDLKPSNLKLPSELKVPGPVRDLYLDLRDRRLLPLVALIVVSIIAVPILLSQSGDDEGPTPAELYAPSVGDDGAAAASLSVVEATPGLRDYRKRLRARDATNPFEQRYTEPITKGADLQSESETSAGQKSSTSDTSGKGPSDDSGDSGGGGGSGGGGSPGGQPELRFYTWTADVQISHTETQPDGSTKMSPPEVRNGIRPPKPLPAEAKPVVTFLGVKVKNEKTLKALMMVSDEVTGVFGDAKCVSGVEQCELLELEPGFPEVFEYGPNNVRYKVKVIRIDFIQTGRT
jgi:hypothetical protein